MRKFLPVVAFVTVLLANVAAYGQDDTTHVNNPLNKKTVKVVSNATSPEGLPFSEDTIQKLNQEIASLGQRINDLRVLWEVTKEVDDQGLFNLPELPSYDTMAPQPSVNPKEGKDEPVEKKSGLWSWLNNLFHRKSGPSESNNEPELVNPDSHEAKVQQLNDDMAGLQKEALDLEEMLRPVMTTKDYDFFVELMMSSCEKAYDSIQIERHKRAIELLDYKDEDRMNRGHDFYYPVLENYGRYNEEMIKVVNDFVRMFERFDVKDLNPNNLKGAFEREYEATDYYKMKKGDGLGRKKIKYLDMVYESTLSLFDDPSKFTKENFVEQLKKLGKEYGNK